MPNPHLPEELLDHIASLLYDERDELKNCCLVSKPWIPRTRKHLFARLGFHTPRNLQSWKNTFPDPSTSPARYTQNLFIDCPQAVTAKDAEEDGWITAFTRVVHFELDIRKRNFNDPAVSLVPFHAFSPIIRSLRVTTNRFPPSRTFDLINSFPLLEDLSVATYDGSRSYDGHNNRSTAVQPLSPPLFTGFLELLVEMGPIASRLLSLPGRLHFRKLNLAWSHENDVSFTTALVESCGSTLESLYIDCRLAETQAGPINLSKATRLKDVAFVWDRNPRWVIMTLKTITPNHQNLKMISVDAPFILFGLNPKHVHPLRFRDSIGEAAYMGWLELDHLLIKFWESHSIRTKVLCSVPSSMGMEGARGCIGSLFSEVMKSGGAELIARGYGRRFGEQLG